MKEHSVCIVWIKEQSDQSLHCLPFRLYEGAVLSGSTLFAFPFGRRGNLIRVYTVCHSVCIVWMKEQSDQGLPCLPFHSHCFDEGAVWSGSTLFAIPFASLGWRSSLIRVYTVCHSMKEQSDQSLHCLPLHLHQLDEGAVWSGSTLFAIPFASFGWRSSLIRVYTVCHSMKEQSDQSLHCLPLHLHRLDEGAFRLHCLDKGAVWSGSTLFAILFGWRSSLIRVYTVCLSVCIVWMKEQSDQGLHCLPFRLHGLDEGAVWSGSTLFAIPFALFWWRSSLNWVYTVCHSVCIVWMK